MSDKSARLSTQPINPAVSTVLLGETCGPFGSLAPPSCGGKRRLNIQPRKYVPKTAPAIQSGQDERFSRLAI
jgi:hypothetical protein